MDLEQERLATWLSIDFFCSGPTVIGNSINDVTVIRGGVEDFVMKVLRNEVG